MKPEDGQSADVVQGKLQKPAPELPPRTMQSAPVSQSDAVVHGLQSTPVPSPEGPASAAASVGVGTDASLAEGTEPAPASEVDPDPEGEVDGLPLEPLDPPVEPRDDE